jgi:hypothetical protein
MGLPLIRGVILNDEKSSTYKLGLLRAIAKIADAAPSLARPAPDGADAVLVPLGLVALNWIRAYLPLVADGLPQAPNNRGADGLGFAKDGFRRLLALGVTPQDLRVGGALAGERALALFDALREARRTIVEMPARYTTLPNSRAPVFAVSPERGAVKDGPLSPEALWSFGTLTVPGHLWRTMLRLSAWIEPVLVAEWARVVRAYALRMGLDLPPGRVEGRLVWIEPLSSTSYSDVNR